MPDVEALFLGTSVHPVVVIAAPAAANPKVALEISKNLLREKACMVIWLQISKKIKIIL